MPILSDQVFYATALNKMNNRRANERLCRKERKKTDEHMKTEEMLGLAAVLAGNTDICIALWNER